MKPTLNTIGIILTLVVLISSCSKDKRISNRIDGKSLCIQEFSIDGISIIPYDTLDFDECKIHKDLCTGMWRRNGGISQFYWQINERGKEFILSNISTIENIPPNTVTYNAINQCYKLSGTYEIIEYKKKGEEFILRVKSSSTMGYPGQVVKFDLKILE